MALYRDGIEVYRIEMGVNKLIDIDTLALKGDNNYNLMDEIALFSRALSESEIMQYFSSDLPLAINDCDLLPPDFGQPYIQWDLETEQYSCSRFLGENISNFPAVFGSEYKSLSFWWKNNSMDNDFNFSVNLLDPLGENLLGLEFDNNNIYHYFNGWKYETGDKYNNYFFPNDDWHPVILTYDPYFFRLNLYVDGNLIGTWRHFWLRNPDIASLKIFSDSKDLRIKNISAWNRCLSDEEVLLMSN